jgi:flavin reductase (DIM6/NTAB) family NADH-FMN oxidoreductase RutF
MRRVPAAVTVVTASTGKESRGMTVGSFTSVSLDPLLVSFNVGKTAAMHGVLIEADYFYVHLLGEDQAYLSNHFARPDLTSEAQFEGIAHRLSEDGTPILSETLAYLRCEKIVVYDAGDHCLMIGRVDAIEQQREGRPLLYYDRGYHGVGDAVPVLLPAEAAGD